LFARANKRSKRDSSLLQKLSCLSEQPIIENVWILIAKSKRYMVLLSETIHRIDVRVNFVRCHVCCGCSQLWPSISEGPVPATLLDFANSIIDIS
jgi:hypothetical protein